MKKVFSFSCVILNIVSLIGIILLLFYRFCAVESYGFFSQFISPYGYFLTLSVIFPLNAILFVFAVIESKFKSMTTVKPIVFQFLATFIIWFVLLAMFIKFTGI